ncbi:hypothetical protein D3OALGA1CA_2407 [Olavius algarvensis associated proteobacterium Delta 3]|nr:hypothetical protein D3OALGA1CA_2407 [Olavius algarvensis associated proteobacterium Delta 3]
MHLNSIQADYGGFNPKYAGVVIRAANQRSFDWFEKSASISEKQILSLPKDQMFEAISMVTVLQHEIRHFHDFLLTPYSQRLWQLRMEILLNGMQIIYHYLRANEKGDFNCIPVPFSSWCYQNKKKRKLLLKQLKDFGPFDGDKKLIPCSLPLFPSHNKKNKYIPSNYHTSTFPIDDLILLTLNKYDQMEDLTFRPGEKLYNFDYQPYHVFELSGLICQLQAIMFDIGNTALTEFSNYIFKMSRAPYTLLLQLLFSIWGKVGEPMSLYMASAIVLWSLLGSYKHDQWKACPTLRFASLVLYLLEKGPPNSSMPYMKLFDEWSSATKLSKVEVALKTAQKEAIDYPKRVNKALSNNPIGEFYKTQENYLPFIESVCKAQRHMIGEFLKKPELYIENSRYLYKTPMYVNPPVRIDMIKGGVLVDDNFKAKGCINYRGGLDKNGQENAKSFSLNFNLSKFNPIMPFIAYDVYMDIAIVDFVFYAHKRYDPDIIMAQEQLQKKGDVIFFNVDV